MRIDATGHPTGPADTVPEDGGPRPVSPDPVSGPRPTRTTCGPAVEA
ncbi:MAG TPA: hypothetical protein VMM13_16615 [Euzebya sp.]|nr:hypothetical protein [Euzebya sp.]